MATVSFVTISTEIVAVAIATQGINFLTCKSLKINPEVNLLHSTDPDQSSKEERDLSNITQQVGGDTKLPVCPARSILPTFLH